ncbi:MAG: hypothetical protein BV457_00960 [Thermoplasmata archaeon M9B1D]|nr:MAG: hypothetical protein BV457_00960 [Thermoplasmata archaeon M9B1D]PNX50484.1 MAG: hypothetical protein BV456_06560 [Thermoplasmata archaeon M8B2D]
MNKKHYSKLISIVITILFLGLLISPCINGKISLRIDLKESLNKNINGRISREKMIEIAEAYVNFEWYPTENNIAPRTDFYILFHNILNRLVQNHLIIYLLAVLNGIKYVDTPDRDTHSDWPETYGWIADEKNIGVPYQWGGFSSISGFDLINPIDFEDQYTGTNSFEGKIYYAGDVFCDTGVISRRACGVDCSGFVSRCWNLSSKQSTRTLNNSEFSLPITIDNLQMGDILLRENHHVMLFKEFVDENRTLLTVYEAGPYYKAVEMTYEINNILDDGHSIELINNEVYGLYTYNAGNLVD